MTGLVSISGITDSFGKSIPLDKAKNYGWINPLRRIPKSWAVPAYEAVLGTNMFVDNGRQLVAFLFGGRTPSTGYCVSQFGLGTGTLAPTSADVELQNRLQFYNPTADPNPADWLYRKPIDGVDFPAPFIARVQFTIGLTEANGILLTEFGLYAQDGGGNATLLARKTTIGLAKNSDFSPVLQWRVRF